MPNTEERLKQSVTGDKISMNRVIYIRSCFSGKMFWVSWETGLSHCTNDILRISKRFNFEIDFNLEG